MTTVIVPDVQLSFPPGWSALASDSSVQDALEAFSVEASESAVELQLQLARALDRLLGLMRKGRVRALAGFHLVDHDPLAMVTALAAVTIEPLDPETAQPLRTLAVVDAPRQLDGAHVVPFQAGPLRGVRATLIRPMSGEPGPPRPMLAVARYAFGVDRGLALLLHFETLSVAYADELLLMFDAIAGAVRLASRGDSAS